MRIKILKSDVCCLAKYNFYKSRYEVGDVCIEECCFDYEIHNAIHARMHEDQCLTKSVSLEEQFFFSIVRYFNKMRDEQSNFIGHLTKDEDKIVINIDKFLSGSRIYPEEHHRFLVTPFYPDSVFFTDEFSRSVLTSDGVITLEQDQFIGVKDGLIEELDVQEVLEIISKGKADTTPLYSSLRLNPVAKRPTRPRKGTVIYNKNNNKIEVYNGQEWTEI